MCVWCGSQGHTLDAASAAAALEALQAERAWALSGPVLTACLEVGALVSPSLLLHILLVATSDMAWRIAKEVLQVGALGTAAEGSSASGSAFGQESNED